MSQLEQVKFVLRLPPTIHLEVKRSAESNNTSMNKEIMNILSESLAGSSVKGVLNDLVKRLEDEKVI
ncbi:MAG: Arc family DNA-binding protein [Gammaproteobacteria bacterium]|nr:Arc family DNA-binding protein [Gammaproteobacteria bacterium]